MTNLTSLMKITAFAVMASGCIRTETLGQYGNAQFAYQPCLFDCSITTSSIAAGGGRATIDVDLLKPSLSWSAISNSNPEVAQVTKNGDDIDILAGIPGKTTVTLLDANNRVVDSTVITVDKTDRLDFKKSWTGAGPTVLADAAVKFHVSTTRVDGDPLVGSGAVKFTGTEAISIVQTNFEWQDAVEFKASEGPATLTADCDDARVELAINSVAPSAITQITFDTPVYSTQESGSERVTVDVTAKTATGEAVYGARCEWSGLALHVTAQNPVASVIGEGPAKTSASFLIPNRNGSTAICTIGTASATLNL